MDTYSEDYNQIKVQATEWPDWKKEAYNHNFATSKNAKKLNENDTPICNFLYCAYNLSGKCSAHNDQIVDCKYKAYDDAKHDGRLFMLNHKATGNNTEIIENVRRIVSSLNYMSER